MWFLVTKQRFMYRIRINHKIVKILIFRHGNGKTIGNVPSHRAIKLGIVHKFNGFFPIHHFTAHALIPHTSCLIPECKYLL